MPDRDLVGALDNLSAVEVLEGVTDYVFILDDDWRIVYVNAEARRRLAHELQVIGRTLWDLFPKSYGTHIRDELEAARASGKPARLTFYGPDLESWFDLSLRSLPSGFEIAFHDMSERGHASAALAQASPPGREVEPARPGTTDLDRLAEQIGELADRIRQIRRGGVGDADQPLLEWSDRNLARIAELIYKDRRLRRSHFAELDFADPQWDILLDLFVQTAAGRPVAVTSACIAADVPDTTALRALRVLQDTGYVRQTSDMLDRRRKWVQLSTKGKQAVSGYLKEVALARMS